MRRLLAITLLVGACAGGGGSADAVPADFASEALAVCQHARELKDAQGAFPFPDFNPTDPDVAKFPEVAVFLEKTATTFETWSADMKALGVPQTGQAAWADVLGAIERHISLNAEQIDAAGRGDRATFSRDYSAGLETQADLLRAATAAGVAACAQVDR